MNASSHLKPAGGWPGLLAGRLRAAVVIGLLSLCVVPPAGAASDSSRANGWKVTAGWSVREAFDSNVLLQDSTPSASLADACAARLQSFVTTVAAVASLTGRATDRIAVSASYAPEASVFHSVRSEDHHLHRFSLGLAGESGSCRWSLQQGATWIDGGASGPVFGGVGGATALGGIPLRERRDAVYGRSQFRLAWSSGAWFVRAVAGLYCHDFLTEQNRRPGYLNYIDRQEWLAGADVGRTVGAKTRVFTGFRRGRQDQLRLHGVDSPFDSTFERWLLGIEGAPATWLQCSAAAGPEVHRFPGPTPAGFDRGKTYWWIDATSTLSAGPRDACVLSMRRFLQPAFSSASVYEDITYEVNWRRRIDPRLALSAGFKAYGGDWPGPAMREDWVFTPSLQIQFAPDSRRAIDLVWSFDRAVSRLPSTPGREFQRHVMGLSYKVTR